MLKWYVAQVQTGRAHTAADRLKRQDFGVCLAKVRERRLRGELVPVVLFPGYLFVSFDMEDPGVRWQSINGTRGVIKLLPLYQERPLPLPVGFVEELSEKLLDANASAESVLDFALSFKRDDPISFSSGPFAGHEGEVLKYHKGSLEILMALLGSKIVVKVPPHQVFHRQLERALV